MRLFKPIRHAAATLAVLAMAVLGTGAAWAAGTDAGVDVTNNVTLDFTVNSVGQDQQTASSTFTVDRKLVIDVTTSDTNYVTATPGSTATLTYTIQNLSNQAGLGAVFGVVRKDNTLVSDFAGTPGGAGTAANTTFTVFVDGVEVTANANGFYAVPGTLAEDGSVTVTIEAAVDTDAANTDYQAFTVVASLTEDADGANVIELDDSGNLLPGTASAAQDNADVATGIQDVFADLDALIGARQAEDTGYDFIAGTPIVSQDEESNNQSSDTSALVVATAAIALTKTAEVLWDPVSGNKYDGTGAATGSNPKAIPGAVVLYVVAVKNGQQGVTPAFDITISDTPSGLMDDGNQAGEAVNLPATTTSGLDTLGIPEVSAGSRAVADADVDVRVKTCGSTTFDVTSDFATLESAGGITVNATGGGTGCGDGDTTFNDDDYAIYVYLMTVQ